MKEKIRLLKALGDETRIKIIQCLIGREKCSCSVIPFVNKAQPTVSRHLKILEDAGILESRRDGVNIWYKIKNETAIQILKLLNIRKIKTKTKCCPQKKFCKAEKNRT